jgi:hypothetical protein
LAILSLSEYDPSFIDESRQLFERLSIDLAPAPGARLPWVRAMINLGRAERLKGVQAHDPALIRKSIETLSSCLGTFNVQTYRVQWIYGQFQLAKSYLELAEQGLIDDNINKCRYHCGEAITGLQMDPANLLVGKVHEILDRLDELTGC